MSRAAAERRLKKLEAHRQHEDKPPPWVLENREPKGAESIMWALDHGRTLEDLIREGMERRTK